MLKSEHKHGLDCRIVLTDLIQILNLVFGVTEVNTVNNNFLRIEDKLCTYLLKVQKARLQNLIISYIKEVSHPEPYLTRPVRV